MLARFSVFYLESILPSCMGGVLYVDANDGTGNGIEWAED